MKPLKIQTLFLLALAMLAVSCQSLKKDIAVSIQREEREINLLELEKVIVELEARAERQAADRARQIEMAEGRKTIGEMEKDSRADSGYAGQIAAWSGRLAILEGRYSEAQRQYRQAQSLSPGNLPSIILGARLEGDPEKRLDIINRELELAGQGSSFSSGAGELQIEKGRTLAQLRRFGEAVGAFDAAFASGIDNIYAESYRDARDRAWELRGAEASGGTFEILERGGLTWKDCISLTKAETQLLRFLTAGRDLPEAELFNRLLERSFIPFTQDVTLNEWPRTRPRIEDPVFRSGAAWLLWHLYAEARADRGMLTRYSSRFTLGSSARSPINDIPALSPFFDSILGCVETELLSLPDGRNFRPAEPIRGTEFLAILRKMSH
jgi:tetratricopeptide (TPR) repeat protein